jgi:hypothetical protein
MNLQGKEARNAILKGLILFVLLTLLYGVWAGNRSVGNREQFSLYNLVFPGRKRLPFGEDSANAYNLSLFDVNAMFSSHEIDWRQKSGNEFRIILLGDSSVWGTLLRPDETLAGQLDSMRLTVCGKPASVYNLGYPTLSITKDLMLLDAAMRYDPDLIVWGVTLEALPADKQLTSPLVSENAARVAELIARYDLPLDPNSPDLVRRSFWENTLIGQRRSLADLVRLQLYGVMWAATGVDQVYPLDYQPAQVDLEADSSFHDLVGPQLDPSALAFFALDAGTAAAGTVPVLVFNEPMLVSSGANSDIRYNFFYPRWAYDQYRLLMQQAAGTADWNYVDLWNLVPADQFTNSAIHLTPAGEALLADALAGAILETRCP